MGRNTYKKSIIIDAVNSIPIGTTFHLHNILTIIKDAAYPPTTQEIGQYLGTLERKQFLTHIDTIKCQKIYKRQRLIK